MSNRIRPKIGFIVGIQVGVYSHSVLSATLDESIRLGLTYALRQSLVGAAWFHLQEPTRSMVNRRLLASALHRKLKDT